MISTAAREHDPTLPAIVYKEQACCCLPPRLAFQLSWNRDTTTGKTSLFWPSLFTNAERHLALWWIVWQCHFVFAQEQSDELELLQCHASLVDIYQKKQRELPAIVFESLAQLDISGLETLEEISRFLGYSALVHLCRLFYLFRESKEICLEKEQSLQDVVFTIITKMNVP